MPRKQQNSKGLTLKCSCTLGFGVVVVVVSLFLFCHQWWQRLLDRPWPASRAAALPSDCIFPVNMLIILGNYESVKCSRKQWGWVDYEGKCSQDFLYQLRVILFGGR